MTEKKTRDVRAQRMTVTLGSTALPAPIEVVGIGNEAIYDDDRIDGGHPPYVGFRPVKFRLVFPVTSNTTLRDIGKSEDRMQEDYSLTINYFATSRTKPVTSTELINVRITSFVQGKEQSWAQPVEIIEGFADQVTPEADAAA